jgi:hypothetical protein
MNEIKNPEINEIKKPEHNNYKEIKSEKGTTADMARSFWNNEFKKETEYYNSYEDRLSCTPKEETGRGKWTGERGESKFIPNNEMPEGKAALDKLNEKGLDGIEYKNTEPDFSKCAEAIVRIDDMTQYRAENFKQADIKCAEKWSEESKDGKSDWTPREVADWREKNHCSWHERCDTMTMDLVPREIHSHCTHLGGVSECKERDRKNGGDFDE